MPRTYQFSHTSLMDTTIAPDHCNNIISPIKGEDGGGLGSNSQKP